MIQQKVRKNAHAGEKLTVQCMANKQMKGVYSWNKIWSLKSLVMLKCERRTSLNAVQCK